MNKRRFFEFFAGGGMARAGLGAGWTCAFANDFDPMKADVYEANWGDRPMVRDVNALTVADLPGHAELVWASFPCQDLSLAGNSAGLGTEGAQTRSGAFWAFWRLVEALRADGRAPPIVVLENVYGSLTANEGRDFAAIARALALGGYRFGAVLIDAVQFLPQSRPRVFVVAVREDQYVPQSLLSDDPVARWHPVAMERAIDRLAEIDRAQWLWFDPQVPSVRPPQLDSVIDDEPCGVAWHTPAETARLVSMMSDVNRQKLAEMQRGGAAVSPRSTNAPVPMHRVSAASARNCVTTVLRAV